MTDQDGRYTIKTIPPGRYKLMALDGVDFGQWQDPEFLKPLEPSATALVISEGAQETKDLKVVAAPAN